MKGEGTSAAELRAIFNAHLLPRIKNGELVEVVISSCPASPHSNQPDGTLSELVEYQENGERVAIVHRFVTKDGEIGGSGRPDPKAIRFGREWLFLDD